jgi:hypothetical protein
MEGYPKLAQLMSDFDEFAMFRRFRALNYRNLLYLQAEIIHLEEELDALSSRDAGHQDRTFYARDWWSLSQGEGDEDTEQWEKVLEIRRLLENYSMCRAEDGLSINNLQGLSRRCLIEKFLPVET